MRIKWLSLIRVLGLFFVLFYHFFIGVFPGGFVGVDLFFTLSGYLTTALFIDEFAQHGTIRLWDFCRRRLYRIVPALLLCILLTLPLALLVRNDFIASIGQQVLAALGFVTNLFEILSGGSYENQFSPHLFVHTWTLALEIHFYIFWGALLAFFSRKAKSVGQLQGLVFLTSFALFLLTYLSLFVSSFLVDNYSAIYYGDLTHSFPFFVGSLLATLAGIKETSGLLKAKVKQWSLKEPLLLFGSGLAVELLLLFTLSFSSQWTYLIGLLLSSLATAGMIFAARVLHEKTPHWTEPALVNYLAEISYGVYLFHWPFYILFSQLIQPTTAALLAALFSFILATVSYYVLEPYLAGKTGQLLGVDIDLAPYGKQLVASIGGLALLGVGICLFSPGLGNFEKESLVSSLYQAQTQLATTRSGLDAAKATSYDIQKGVTIFGDSVTVRASTALQAALPEAQIDGTVSRHLTEISGLVTLYKENNTLKETVVVSLGTNTSDNYKELLDQLLADFPEGHRLIFVTPYDGNYTPSQSLAYQTGHYEKELAKQHDYIHIADWYQVAKDTPAIWLNSDLVHFSLDSEGDKVFAKTVHDAIKKAADSPIKE